VHAAAAAARRHPKKSASSKSKLQPETLSTGSSLHTVAAAAAVPQLSYLPAVHSQHGDALDQFKQSVHKFYGFAAGPLGLAGPLRVNPTNRGHLAAGPAMQVLWYAWNKLLDGMCGRTQYDLEHLMRRHDPR
jgi:hypothetical protein